MGIKSAQIFYDPDSKTCFIMDPASIDQSFVKVLAEGYVFCQWANGKSAWVRKRKRWKVATTDQKNRFKSAFKAWKNKSRKGAA